MGIESLTLFIEKNVKSSKKKKYLKLIETTVVGTGKDNCRENHQ